MNNIKEQLWEYLDGNLKGQEKIDFERSLEDSEELKAELSMLKNINKLMLENLLETPEKQLTESVFDKIIHEELTKQIEDRNLFNINVKGILALFATLFVGLIMISSFMPDLPFSGNSFSLAEVWDGLNVYVKYSLILVPTFTILYFISEGLPDFRQGI